MDEYCIQKSFALHLNHILLGDVFLVTMVKSCVGGSQKGTKPLSILLLLLNVLVEK